LASSLNGQQKSFPIANMQMVFSHWHQGTGQAMSWSFWDKESVYKLKKWQME
jgi:hypothetical protein